MNHLLEQLSELYRDKDKYRELCEMRFTLPAEMRDLLKTYQFRLEAGEQNAWPSVSHYIQCGKFEDAPFRVEYHAELTFSKLRPCYVLSYQYEVDNRDPRALSSYLRGNQEEPFNVPQFDFNAELNRLLASQGWQRLSLAEQQMVVPDLAFANEGSIFHGPVTVWDALAEDVCNWLENSE